MASAPPTLPMSTPQPQDPSTALSTPAARALLSRLSDTARLAFSHRRPWSELLDRSAFARPDTLSDATSRLRKNAAYFRINYLTLLASVLALSLLTNPFSLLLLSFLLASWTFLYFLRPADSPPLVILGREFSPRETLFGLVIATVIVFFLTSVGSILISALMIGMAIVCAHGAFRVPDDLFLDEQESTATGLLAFLGAPASAPAPPPPPPVAPRV